MAAVETITQPSRTMLEVFESLPEGTHVQLIENTLVMSPSPIDLHQYIAGEIFGELRSYLKRTKAGKLRIAPSDVHFDEYNIYQPDVYVVLNQNLEGFKKNGFYGAPDLVVEILSPATAKYDLNEKKAVYERFGVTEYWIINPEKLIATGYHLENDEYHQFFQENGILKSRLLDITIEF